MSEYTIINAGITTVVKNIEIEGQPATINQEKLVVELIPDDGFSGTIKIIRPPVEIDSWPLDAKVSVEFTVIGE